MLLLFNGQGNFIFDHSDSEYWKTSLLLKIEITDKLNVEYIPFVKEENVIRKADEKQEKEILGQFKKRSEEILQEGFISHQYAKFAENNIEKYLRTFSGFGKWMSRVDRHIFKGKLLKKMNNEKKLLAMQNFIECEAHRELIVEGLKKKINQKK